MLDGINVEGVCQSLLLGTVDAEEAWPVLCLCMCGMVILIF